MDQCKNGVLIKKQINARKHYRSTVKIMEEKGIQNKIINNDVNNLDFNQTVPGEKVSFHIQRTNYIKPSLKEKKNSSSFKIFRKENRKPAAESIDRKISIKESQSTLISQIYFQFSNYQYKQMLENVDPFLRQEEELDKWQKTIHHKKNNFSSQYVDQEVVRLNFVNYSGIKSYDYEKEIAKRLYIILMTHNKEKNMLNRYILIQNSSKLIKKELQDKMLLLQSDIKSRKKMLYQARAEYHGLYEQRNKLLLQEQILKDRSNQMIYRKSFNLIVGKQQKSQKTYLIQINLARITKTRKNIQFIEEVIIDLEEQLKHICQALTSYYKITLKIGTDVRSSGLVWVVRKLQISHTDLKNHQFPPYLDIKSIKFIIQKAHNQIEQEQLLEKKRIFVNQIGKLSLNQNIQSTNTSKKENLSDIVIQRGFTINSNIPKKYRRSLRRLSALAEQFDKNSPLFQIRGGNKGMQISADLQGLTHKEIYTLVGERIKKIDLANIKKEKQGSQGVRLLQYQSILQKIKQADIKSEEMDLQHEKYLLNQYPENSNNFFIQAAACFGYKRAYSMIIKHYSWKYGKDQLLHNNIQ